jgi:hypothetical protein
MNSQKNIPVLRCPECDCRAFEVHGTLTYDSVVQCVECSTELGRVPDVIEELTSRVAQFQEAQRRARLH